MNRSPSGLHDDRRNDGETSMLTAAMPLGQYLMLVCHGNGGFTTAAGTPVKQQNFWRHCYYPNKLL